MQSALKNVPGVSSVDVSLAENKATVQVEKGKVNADQLTAAVKQAGFSATQTQ